MAQDPTRDDMLAFLATLSYASEADEFDREEAVYWFAHDWHGGQSSALYAALCATPYRPGPLARGCDPDSMAGVLYDALEAQYAPN